MQSDAELLDRFIQDRTSPAFPELVQRHLGFVYTTSLCRVGFDTHLAEDVTQLVFAALARKAPSLSGRASLRGWLFVSAHHAAAAIVRREQRRRRRELDPHAMQTLHPDPAPPIEHPELLGWLEEAIVQLRADEREAIALRFFEQRSFFEVGAALQLSEEAARKRVTRAVDKLRSLLQRRGATADVALLNGALVEFGTGAAPAGLAAKITGLALAQAAAAGGGVAAWVSGVLASAAVLFGLGLVAHQYRSNRELATEVQRIGSCRDEIASLRRENQVLAQAIAEAGRRRHVQRVETAGATALVAAPPGVAPAPIPQATLTIESNGTIRWNEDHVTLRDFLDRLGALPQGSASGDSSIHLRNHGQFSQLDYVVDEIRKARIPHLIVESTTPLDPQADYPWLGPR